MSESGQHITGINGWGYCDQNCSTHDEDAVASTTSIATSTDASIVFQATTSQSIADNSIIPGPISFEDDISFGQKKTDDLLIADLPLESDQTCGLSSSKRSE